MNYHLKVITVGPQATFDGRVVSSDTFDNEIREWLTGGWRIRAIDYVGPEREAGGLRQAKEEPIGQTFAYHFVKESDNENPG